MGILIADSGATKTEWCVTSLDKDKMYKTEGLYPYYHTVESIERVIEGGLLAQLNGTNISEIFFYGAGCDSEEKKGQVRKALQKCFSEAVYNIYHDVLGAARAWFFDEPGIACLLGTGCNSCLYYGHEIVVHIRSLVFIL